MEIIIGRQVDEINNIKVPETYSMVSRIHAKISIDQKNMTIEDTSANGTFVNNISIKKKNISANDSVILGDKINGFKVNLNEVIEKYNNIVNQNKTDFTLEFIEIEKVHSDYRTRISNLKKTIGKKNSLPKIIITISSMMLVIILGFLGILPPNLTIVFTSIIPLIGGYIYSQKSNNDELNDKIYIVTDEYLNKFVCPKCKKQLKEFINKPIEILQKRKNCPHNCGAKFYN